MLEGSPSLSSRTVGIEPAREQSEPEMCLDGKDVTTSEATPPTCVLGLKGFGVKRVTCGNPPSSLHKSNSSYTTAFRPHPALGASLNDLPLSGMRPTVNPFPTTTRSHASPSKGNVNFGHGPGQGGQRDAHREGAIAS